MTVEDIGKAAAAIITHMVTMNKMHGGRQGRRADNLGRCKG